MHGQLRLPPATKKIAAGSAPATVARRVVRAVAVVCDPKLRAQGPSQQVASPHSPHSTLQGTAVTADTDKYNNYVDAVLYSSSWSAEYSKHVSSLFEIIKLSRT